MTTEQARQMGQNDALKNKGPANTNGWDSNSKNAYEAAYKQTQQKK